MSRPQCTIAVPKGKLLEPALQWLAQREVHAPSDILNSRQLAVADSQNRTALLLVKPADVPIYVEYGIADLGIVGLDILREQQPDVFEPLALPFGRCRMVVAGPPDEDYQGLRLRSLVRVGTKYPNIARQHFYDMGVQAEIIALQGSVELSVAVGLADIIVDIVETGTTLRQNGLVVLEEIFESTARLIVNKASHKLKHHLLDPFLQN